MCALHKVSQCKKVSTGVSKIFIELHMVIKIHRDIYIFLKYWLYSRNQNYFLRH